MTPIFSIKDDAAVVMQSMVRDPKMGGFFAGYRVNVADDVECVLEIKVAGLDVKGDISVTPVMTFAEFKDRYKEYNVAVQNGRFRYEGGECVGSWMQQPPKGKPDNVTKMA